MKCTLWNVTTLWNADPIELSAYHFSFLFNFYVIFFSLICIFLFYVPRYSQTMEEHQENSDHGEDVDEDEIEEIKCNSQEGPRHLR